MNEKDPHPDDTLRWREDAIRKYVRRRREDAKRPSVGELARELGLSIPTTYRMFELFKAGCTVTSLMAKSPGRRRGHHALDTKRESIIQQAIESVYLKPTKSPFARLVHEIRRRCFALELPPPHFRTIKKHLVEIDVRARARQRGEAQLLKTTIAVPGGYRPSRPLEIVQIDHAGRYHRR